MWNIPSNYFLVLYYEKDNKLLQLQCPTKVGKIVVKKNKKMVYMAFVISNFRK